MFLFSSIHCGTTLAIILWTTLAIILWDHSCDYSVDRSCDYSVGPLLRLFCGTTLYLCDLYSLESPFLRLDDLARAGLGDEEAGRGALTETPLGRGGFRG